ncbi:DNA replication complex GINS protein PSF1 [Kwoniella mangroviensis CBS 10435]|uniref:DNA replication complex GINS protein PSF1 n=1 Tax=Kwoniella mangroviensis CBS 10435 TaxID=1331196 RepID=A0A1B9IQH7_9TREE|nr:DNA replication complex GINS protein PSF1 [Kwoniella mangroviensis CBS 8507]OCF57690.1 DNA replication complex GINS protein PSF1 [Kwoniella mangroviensis CBS 10435]OCF69985.1 DNA replication complex GINS protein PSF1 [Kwoniella mangroviensis CBS 8507]OCF75762.1 DNA replication complex GINS protein PSF1 [Kwoniella mangroviensis CBS 8886]
MYGDLALQLVTSSHRSTLSTTPQLPLPKYALPLILSICLETRQLGQSITSAAEQHGQVSLSQDRSLVCNLTVQHLSARRNKRCLLAYLSTRVGGIKERWWDSGGSLAYLLSPSSSSTMNNSDPSAINSSESESAGDLRNNLSPQELDFLRGYNNLMIDYKSDFLDVLDLTSSIDRPPSELMVDVRVLKDAGEVVLEGGEKLDFRKGERFRLNRSNVERLIVQGYLEEV